MMGVLLMQALFILLVMLILALLVSYQLTKKIVKPINTLDLEHPEQVSTYEELDPLLCKLASQNREIVQKMDILRQQQYEFSMITEHMQEGLFVIDHAYTILTCNQSAMRLFGLQHSVLQKNILTVERGEPFRNVLDEALRGRHCTSQLAGLYPCGEGAGYAGGIMSAAVDGLRVARAIISRYAPAEG